MKYKFFVFLVNILFLSSCGHKTKELKLEEKTPIPPNIIFILADDFGIVDSQAYAKYFTGIDTSKMFYETPNINKLINEGTSFSQAYSNPLCSPTRASLLTGKSAARLGFTTAMPRRSTFYNENMDPPAGNYAHDVLEHKDNIEIQQAWKNATSNSAVPTGTSFDSGKDELSIAEALLDYHSAFIGKWHIGGFGAEGYQPRDHGFEALSWFDAGGSPYYNWRNLWNNREKRTFPKMPQATWEIGDSGKFFGEDYLTDELTAQALSYIEERSLYKDQPFFLYFSHFAVHSPYQGIESEVAYFEQKGTKGWNGHKNPVYASMIKSMDRSIGAILEKLKETGLEENTLVIFMSDNGGIDAILTPDLKGTNNDPFLGGKATLNEGGIRVPLIFRWKGKIKGGEWVDLPVDCTDLFPTILAAAGYNSQDIIKSRDLDGQNFWPLLMKREFDREKYMTKPIFWHYPFNVIYNSPYDGFSLTPHSAIRQGNYKLIFDWQGRLFLYNIKSDPFEKNNLHKKFPEITIHLFNTLISWLETNVDEQYWPEINPNYDEKKEVRDENFKNLYQLYKDNNNQLDLSGI